jgi:hypothetical protein
MRITLLRTGGFIPMTKKAETEVNWTDEEMEKLIDKIKIEDDEPGNKRDATSYQLMYAGGTYPIDIEKVPPEYGSTFDELKNNLKVSK